jgi:hypothetical protein
MTSIERNLGDSYEWSEPSKVELVLGLCHNLSHLGRSAKFQMVNGEYERKCTEDSFPYGEG